MKAGNVAIRRCVYEYLPKPHENIDFIIASTAKPFFLRKNRPNIMDREEEEEAQFRDQLRALLLECEGSSNNSSDSDLLYGKENLQRLLLLLLKLYQTRHGELPIMPAPPRTSLSLWGFLPRPRQPLPPTVVGGNENDEAAAAHSSFFGRRRLMQDSSGSSMLALTEDAPATGEYGRLPDDEDDDDEVANASQENVLPLLDRATHTLSDDVLDVMANAARENLAQPASSPPTARRSASSGHGVCRNGQGNLAWNPTETLGKWVVAAALVLVLCVAAALQSHVGQGHQYCQDDDDDESPLSHRWKEVSQCVTKLSEIQATEWQVHSHSYKTALWFMGPGYDIPVEHCEWGTRFGDLYALLVLRQSLQVVEESWYRHDHDMAVPAKHIDVCHWRRVTCDDDDDGQERVTGLSFNNANIAGTLPPEIGGLVDLKTLQVFDNQAVFGPLPTQLGQLNALVSLQVHKTSIGGTVPTELGELSHLQGLLLEETLLTGTMPREICDLRREGSLDTLRASCQQGEGHIAECSCCTACH